ncbi:MAG: hypothetical protein AABX47_07895 [Nanoarchaeota archaeon]
MGDCSLCGAKSHEGCTRTYCPKRIRYESFAKMQPLARLKDYSGPAPAPFVGRYGYPHVNVGILSTPTPPRDADELDAPRKWAALGYGVGDVVEVRSSLINARFTSNVRNPSRFVAVAQEVGMASRPADVEIKLKDRPGLALHMDTHASPNGPAAIASSINLNSNPTVSSKVEKVVSDTDWKAADAAWYLFNKGFDENHIMKMLSVGTLGAKAQRRPVPTRWSITASDDIIGKRMIGELGDLPETDCSAFYGGYLGNHYLILCFPGPWSYELFETMVKPNLGRGPEEIESWTDYEGPYGRKDYASDTVGGYYACRIGVVERLIGMKRKGSVLALRFVTEDYSMPLGVWVVREATRNSMATSPIMFSDENLMLCFASAKVKKTFGIDISGLLRRSKLLDLRRRQPRLDRFASPDLQTEMN